MADQTVIRAKLTQALDPLVLDIIDESHLHAGHNLAAAGGGTHFRITVVSAAFEGEGSLARHRRIHAILNEELAGDLHALALVTRTPAEAGKA